MTSCSSLFISGFGAAAAFFAQMAADLDWHVMPTNGHGSTSSISQNNTAARVQNPRALYGADFSLF
jgi:hypothetical protein